MSQKEASENEDYSLRVLNSFLQLPGFPFARKTRLVELLTENSSSIQNKKSLLLLPLFPARDLRCLWINEINSTWKIFDISVIRNTTKIWEIVSFDELCTSHLSYSERSQPLGLKDRSLILVNESELTALRWISPDMCRNEGSIDSFSFEMLPFFSKHTD